MFSTPTAPTAQPLESTLFQYVRAAKLKPQSVVVSTRFLNAQTTQTNTNSLSNLDKGKNGQYNGYLSPASRRRVKGIIESWLTACQFSTSMKFPTSFPSQEVYPTFLTLTLPSMQLHCDKLIKNECFDPFMQYLREKWAVKNYIWVAETQKNSNIHFHVILDRALPAGRLQEVWNRMLERLGYVGMFRDMQNYIYRNGFKVRKDMMNARLDEVRKAKKSTSQKYDRAEAAKAERKRQKEAYTRGVAANWSNPPTTKIHAIQNIKKLTAYVSKYMTKAPEPVQMHLAPNQRLEQRPDGLYEIVTVDHQEFGGKVWEQEYRDLVPVQFRTRQLRGRIWGASDALHTADLSPYSLVLEQTEKVQIMTPITRKRTIERPVYSYDIFGNARVVGHDRQTQYSTSYETTEEFRRDENAYGMRYLEYLKSVVPKEDIDRATNRAGAHFAAQRGEVIPLSDQQKDLLQAYAPPIYDEYRAHYQALFASLYEDAA